MYLHEYTADGLTIRGLVGALDLGRASVPSAPTDQAVFPHEGVHEDQVDELATRLLAMGVNPAPILLVHRGRGNIAALVSATLDAPPTAQFADSAGQFHRIWAIRGDSQLDPIAGRLADTEALIADGHHRYAAYLRLRDQQPDPRWQSGLAMLVDQDETPLWLGAIHRHLAGRRLDQTVAELATLPGHRCEISDRQRALGRLGRRTLVLTDHTGWVLLHLPDTPHALAVSSLEDVVLPHLGVSKQMMTYHHSVESALLPTRAGRGVSVLMPSPGFDDVIGAAAAGRLLPEKATSFQPKPTMGVLLRSLRDG